MLYNAFLNFNVFYNNGTFYVIYCSMPESTDDNWDSPLNRQPEARHAFKILKHSYAVRGND